MPKTPEDNKTTEEKALREKVLERVRKLLALSGNNPNLAEAAAAAGKAEALLAEYNITTAQVQLEEISRGDGFTREKVYANINKGSAKRTPHWAQWLAVSVGEFYDCHCQLTDGMAHVTKTRQQRVAMLEFVGYDTDVTICVWTFQYLFQQAVRASHVYEIQLENKGIRWNAMKTPLREFREGVSGELCQRLRAMLQERTPHAPDSTGNALVVAKRAAIERQFGEFIYKTTDQRGKPATESWKAGREAGRRINIGVTPITGESDSGKLK